MSPFLRCHRANHTLHPSDLLLTPAQVGALQHLGAAGQHGDEIFERAKLFHLTELIQEVLQRELSFAQFLFQPLRVVQLHRLGGFFDEADDVAQAKNA